MNLIEELRNEVERFGTGPLLSEMPRRTLQDKGIAGPTAAHRIEEVHTPTNFAYVTFTTGSSAFQNLVGVTVPELRERIKAGVNALEKIGLRPGDQVLITYPPLVNVFPYTAFEHAGVSVRFIQRPSRDAFLAALCASDIACVIGESSFLRASIQDAKRLGLSTQFPTDLKWVAAGGPLDLTLLEEIDSLPGSRAYDLYGCQEFGWIALNGIPLRDDILLWAPKGGGDWAHVIVGGLSTGDMFRIGCHPLDPEGMICTQTRRRAPADLETTVLSTTVSGRDTMLRAAKTILRIKAKIVRVSPEISLCGNQTVLAVSAPEDRERFVIHGPVSTKLFDDLVEAQKMYQREKKTDMVWNKPW